MLAFAACLETWRTSGGHVDGSGPHIDHAGRAQTCCWLGLHLLGLCDSLTGVGGGQGAVGAVVFTHPDVDHILGNQAATTCLERLYRRRCP